MKAVLFLVSGIAFMSFAGLMYMGLSADVAANVSGQAANLRPLLYIVLGAGLGLFIRGLRELFRKSRTVHLEAGGMDMAELPDWVQVAELPVPSGELLFFDMRTPTLIVTGYHSEFLTVPMGNVTVFCETGTRSGGRSPVAGRVKVLSQEIRDEGETMGDLFHLVNDDGKRAQIALGDLDLLRQHWMEGGLLNRSALTGGASAPSVIAFAAKLVEERFAVEKVEGPRHGESSFLFSEPLSESDIQRADAIAESIGFFGGVVSRKHHTCELLYREMDGKLAATLSSVGRPYVCGINVPAGDCMYVLRPIHENGYPGWLIGPESLMR